MKKLTLFATILFALAGSSSYAQSSETIRKYIETYKEIAVEEMVRTGVPASITLAQGIHETGAGTSPLVIKSNNHFGIKCKTEWKGQSVSHDDDARGECFRKYDNPFDSYRDHSDFLKFRPYYTSLFDLDPTDYKSWAHGLKKAGYATNPKYASILIKLIEDYNLQDYTMLAIKYSNSSDIALVNNDENKVENNSIEEIKPEPVVYVQKIYPSSVFKINETSVIFVPKGSSFLAIADKNNISLSRLFDFNDMKPVDIAERDQLIFLQRKRKLGAAEFHTVAAGETLYDIAQEEGIRLENLLEYNLLKPGMQPRAGEKLNLQSKAVSMPKIFTGEMPGVSLNVSDRPSIAGDEFIVHIVQPKETVFAISKKYAVDMNQLLKWNGMSTAELKPGQQIRINKSSANAN